MKLLFLVALTMMAFAANSILTRIGVATYGMDPFAFAVIRVAAGAVFLVGYVSLRGHSVFTGLPTRWRGALALTVYMVGFSWAYQSLDAGLGALILFGALQMMMFGWAVFRGQLVPALRWVGAVFSLVGLVVLLWPSEKVIVSPVGAVAMIAAAAGWAFYTILGQETHNSLAVSAGNFLFCFPLVALSLVFADGGQLTFAGVTMAIVAGGITSGMGYALWYHVLPALSTTVAAVAQLSVPIIAVLAGVIFLAEPVSIRLFLASALVLGGIAVSNLRWVTTDSR